MTPVRPVPSMLLAQRGVAGTIEEQHPRHEPGNQHQRQRDCDDDQFGCHAAFRCNGRSDWGLVIPPGRPSGVRIFSKSVHVMAAGWLVCVLWLWGAGMRQHYRRSEELPPDYGAAVLMAGLIAGAVLELAALAMTRWTGRAPEAGLERREWHHAFWWALCPNLMLLGTVYIMIAAP